MWSALWPTFDEVTLDGDLGMLARLTSTGGPHGYWYALSQWGEGRLASDHPTQLTDAIDGLVNAITQVQVGQQLTGLRSDAVAINAICA